MSTFRDRPLVDQKEFDIHFVFDTACLLAVSSGVTEKSSIWGELDVG